MYVSLSMEFESKNVTNDIVVCPFHYIYPKKKLLLLLRSDFFFEKDEVSNLEGSRTNVSLIGGHGYLKQLVADFSIYRFTFITMCLSFTI
jgi:hypothetical protein